MRIKIGMALAAVLLLAGCSAAASDVAEEADPSVALAELPTERPEFDNICAQDVTSGKTPELVGVLALTSCKSLPEWLAAVESKGQSPSVEMLAAACDGQDHAAVCADSIERGVIASTGNGSLARLAAAASWCGVSEVQDEGSSVTVTSPPGQPGMGAPGCLLLKLGAPDYVEQHMESTRALDGHQTDEWDGLEARWTYHPDDGITLTLIDRIRG